MSIKEPIKRRGDSPDLASTIVTGRKNNSASMILYTIIIVAITFVAILMVKDSLSRLNRVFFVNNPYFSIDKFNIEVKIDGDITNENKLRAQLDAALTIIERKSGNQKLNLLALDLSKIVASLKKNNPQIEHISMAPLLPNGLEVNVRDRFPVARVFSSSGFFIDGGGFIIPSAAGFPHLPVITVANENIKTGKVTSNAQLLRAVELLEHLQVVNYGFLFDIKKISLIRKEFITIFLRSNSNQTIKEDCRIILDFNDMKKSLARAAKIISSRDLDKITTSYIDASYEKNIPVK